MRRGFPLLYPSLNIAFLMKDVKDVGYVIVSTSIAPFFPLAHRRLQNYDFPNNCEDYIHRIGRTGVGFSYRRFNFSGTNKPVARWNERNFLHVLYDGQRETSSGVDWDPA